MDEEEKKSNKKPIIIVLVYFLAIVILMGMIYSYLLDEESEQEEIPYINVDLHYITKNDNGSYLFEIEVNGSLIYYLYDVNITVYRVENEPREIIYKDILLSWAHINFQNTSLDQNVTYNDLDRDGLLSTGDVIFIWIDPAMPGNYTVEMNSIGGKALSSFNFGVQ
jgi:hypothetical protein